MNGEPPGGAGTNCACSEDSRLPSPADGEEGGFLLLCWRMPWLALVAASRCIRREQFAAEGSHDPWSDSMTAARCTCPDSYF